MLTTILDMAGVAVFAISGALAAARAGQTIVTFALFAAVTGIGGGTLRDLLIGAPVFWVGRSDYLGVCLIAAAAVWLVKVERWPLKTLLWLDAVGLGAYAVIGTSKALAYGVPPLPAIVMGVLTACFGGILRDVLAGVPSVILRPEIYVFAAVLGASSFALASSVGAPTPVATALGFIIGFGVRALAIARGISLPSYRQDDSDSAP